MTAQDSTLVHGDRAAAGPRIRWTRRLGGALLGANAAIAYAFLYLPVLILIIFSFNDTRSVAVFTGFSTEWYEKLATNDELLAAARNSMLVGLVTTAGATVIGTMTALAMDRYRFRGRTGVDANLYLPIVIPEIVMGVSLLLFFNQALFPFVESLTGRRPVTGLPTITISHIAFSIPFVYVIVRARLADFDRRLEEAAQDLGANLWQMFYRVTLPLLMPAITGGALLAFTLSLDDYLITTFTKGVQSQTMPLYIYSLVRRGVTPEINALSTALLVGSMALVGLSLAAQSAVQVYTLAIGLGGRLGLAAFGVFSGAMALAGGQIGPSLLLYALLIALALWGMRRRVLEWWAELGGTNTAGQLLAMMALLVVAFAVFFSLRLLFAG